MSWRACVVVLTVAVLSVGCAADGGATVLSGTVVDPAGRPVAGATVAVVDAPVAVPDIAAITGDDGSFSFGVPAAGSYRVAAYGESGSGEATVVVDSGGTSVRLVLEP